jgi:hypothetical protein
MKKMLIVAAVLSLTACSSVKYKQDIEVQAPKFGDSQTVRLPDWYLTADKEENAIYGVASEKSGDMQFAVDKAMLSAKRELASNFSSHINAMMKDYAAETGGANSEVLQEVNRTTKLVVSKVNLIGVQRTNFKIDREGTGFRAYVKVRYAVDDSNKLLLEEIRKNQKLSHKFESSKAFRELENEVEGKQPVEKAEPATKSDDKVSANTIQLLPVDNVEYKKRRDEALAKPGAVIGQTTVQ